MITSGGGASGGVGGGLNIALRKGTAYDVIGKTIFTAYSVVHPGNQGLQEGSKNPQMIVGGEVGGDVAYQWSNKQLFEDAFNAQSVSIPTGFSAKLGVGGGMSFGPGTFGVSAGLGIGGTLKTGNQTSLKSSYSITYGDNGIVNRSIDNDYIDMRVSNSIPIRNNKGQITGYSGTLEVNVKDPEGVATWEKTSIHMTSGATVDSKTGSASSDQIWKSDNYKKEAAKQTDN